MTADLHTVVEDEPLVRAARTMIERGIRQVLVTDREGALAGVLSYRAILRLLASRRTPPLDDSTPIAEFVERDAPTIAADAPILDVVEILTSQRVSALPVVEGDRLVGIVSEHDLMNVTESLLEQAAPRE